MGSSFPACPPACCAGSPSGAVVSPHTPFAPNVNMLFDILDVTSRGTVGAIEEGPWRRAAGTNAFSPAPAGRWSRSCARATPRWKTWRGRWDLTDNAVRAHLAALERDGLVVQSGLRRGHGETGVRLRADSEAERFFPKAYGALLRLMLDALSERLPTEAFDDLLRDVGRRLAAGQPAPAAICGTGRTRGRPARRAGRFGRRRRTDGGFVIRAAVPAGGRGRGASAKRVCSPKRCWPTSRGPGPPDVRPGRFRAAGSRSARWPAREPAGVRP